VQVEDRRVERFDHLDGIRVAAVRSAQAHAAPREGGPNWLLVCPAGQHLVGQQQGIAAVQKRRVGRLQLERVHHQLQGQHIAGVAATGGITGFDIGIEPIFVDQ
jgi:hypothetical protein